MAGNEALFEAFPRLPAPDKLPIMAARRDDCASGRSFCTLPW